jgi:carbon-monoxide dehydrogenase medium subunit
MNLWRQYLIPTTLSEALQALRAAPRPVVPIAGGTDLLIDLEQGRRSAAHTLVDLTAVAEMTVLEMRGDALFIGSAVPLARIAGHPLVAKHAGGLVEACQLIGGPQVRNVATLGGNVAHALPAADGTIALLALDGSVEIASLGGPQIRPLSELFAGPGKSTLRSGEELIVGFHVARSYPSQGSCFRRIMRPQGVALPILNLAVWLERHDKTVADVRIAVGPGGPKPRRAHAAEAVLIGQVFSERACTSAAEALLDDVAFRDSARRASAEYRRHLVRQLLLETLSCAWERAS